MIIIGKAVKSLHQDYAAIPTTLKALDGKQHDAAGKGLLMPLNTFKFIVTIYILNMLIPILDLVSKSFQKGSVTFSHIAPNLAYAKEAVKQWLDKKKMERRKLPKKTPGFISTQESVGEPWYSVRL